MNGRVPILLVHSLDGWGGRAAEPPVATSLLALLFALGRIKKN
jgi:hypothetical protein